MFLASTKQSITLLVLEEMSVLWFQLLYRLVWVFWTVRWSDPGKYLETYSELLPGGEATYRCLKTFQILITSLITALKYIISSETVVMNHPDEVMSWHTINVTEKFSTARPFEYIRFCRTENSLKHGVNLIGLLMVTDCYQMVALIFIDNQIIHPLIKII